MRRGVPSRGTLGCPGIPRLLQVVNVGAGASRRGSLESWRTCPEPLPFPSCVRGQMGAQRKAGGPVCQDAGGGRRGSGPGGPCCLTAPSLCPDAAVPGSVCRESPGVCSACRRFAFGGYHQSRGALEDNPPNPVLIAHLISMLLPNLGSPVPHSRLSGLGASPHLSGFLSEALIIPGGERAACCFPGGGWGP